MPLHDYFNASSLILNYGKSTNQHANEQQFVCQKCERARARISNAKSIWRHAFAVFVHFVWLPLIFFASFLFSTVLSFFLSPSVVRLFLVFHLWAGKMSQILNYRRRKCIQNRQMVSGCTRCWWHWTDESSSHTHTQALENGDKINDCIMQSCDLAFHSFSFVRFVFFFCCVFTRQFSMVSYYSKRRMLITICTKPRRESLRLRFWPFQLPTQHNLHSSSTCLCVCHIHKLTPKCHAEMCVQQPTTNKIMSKSTKIKWVCMFLFQFE